MKNKSDLKRKVLCSLLAASTMGIFYSSDALAASVDNILVKGDEMSADVVDPSKGNGGYVYGITGGNAYVDSTTTQYDEWNGTTETVAGGLKGTVDGVNAIISTLGSFAGLDQSLIDAVGNINAVLQKAESANAQSDTTINGDTGLYLENYGYDWVRYYGAIGGDMSVNTGLQGSAILSIGDADGTELLKESEDTSIVRNGNINNTINSGSVIGGVGGSAAMALGNINVKGEISKGSDPLTATIKADITLDGKTSTTINGNVNTNVAPNANVIGWTNGGTAVGLGGIAESTVDGNTVITIDGSDRSDHQGSYEKPGANDILPQLTTALNIMKGSKINAIGVAGGGMAVTTIGGKADSNVNGTTTININNATVLGAIGGGIAGSVDATGVAEAIIDPSEQYANNDGTTDFGIGMKDGGGFEILTGEAEKDAPIKVTVDEAIQGGTATATTGDTNIALTGNSTAVGVIGGGVAVASHTYTVRPESEGGTLPEGYGVNDEYGKSEATATAGKSHITINLDNTGLDGNAKSAMLKAVSSFKDKLVKDTNNLQADELKALANKGAAVGVFGGGAAIAQSGNRQFIDEENKDQPLSEKDGAFATATTDGSQIDIYSGYVVGVMGGGIAGTDNNATAKSEMTDTVDININGIVAEEGEKSTEVVGVFGNGFAYFTGSSPEGKNNLKGQAVVTAEDTNINVYGGKVDGIVNGGLAIDDSQSDAKNAIVTTTNGTINIGSNAEVNTIDFAAFNGIVGNVPTDKIDMASYVAGVKEAAEGIAIAAGGVAVGGGAESIVENAEVNVFGTVNDDIIGGGVAAYGFTQKDADNGAKGAHVNTSTLNLYAGAEIKGNVYAGGSASDMTKGGSGYDQAQATVDNSTINLAGADVDGFLTGKGVSGTVNDKAKSSIMNVSGENTLGLVNDDKLGTVSKISAFNETNFRADSVTTLDGSLAAGNTVAVIDGALVGGTNGVITVADGAKLDVSQLTADKDNAYLVASNYAESSEFWTNDALVYDRTENYADAINSDDGYKVSYKDLADLTEEEQDKAVKDFVDSLGEGGVNFEGTANGIIRNGENTNAGAKDFFGDYTKGEGTSRDLAAMAMIGEAAGVTSNTIDVAGDMADNSVLRLSFTQDNITGEPKVNEDGAIWAKYIHNKHDLDGMASSFGSVDSSSDFDGATIGVDFAKKGKVQSGIAFSYGSGDSHGMGINNDFDMWGVSLYGNVKNDDTNVIADIGFSESDNELTGTAMGKDIKADRDVSVFTVGVRAEKLYTNGSTQIVPYTGLRYYNVDPDSYTAYYDGQKFGEYDADRQNIWTLPVGVSLRNETVTESGWRLTPKVDVAYIWAFGDTDNSFDLNTGSGVDTLDYTVMDSGSWLGSVGFEAGKDDWAFGVGYSYQKGSHEEANKWFVNVEYSF